MFPSKPSQIRFAALADFSDPNSNLMTIGQNSCNGYRSCSKGIEEIVGDNMCNNIDDKCYENWNMFQAGVWYVDLISLLFRLLMIMALRCVSLEAILVSLA
jgi:hypothetical protein